MFHGVSRVLTGSESDDRKIFVVLNFNINHTFLFSLFEFIGTVVA